MLPTRINSTLKTVYCTRCGATYDPNKINTIYPKCGGVLYVGYDMEYTKTLMNSDLLRKRPRSLGLWRFMELLPVKEGDW